LSARLEVFSGYLEPFSACLEVFSACLEPFSGRPEVFSASPEVFSACPAALRAFLLALSGFPAGGGGPPHSKTLARWPMTPEPREASWSAPALRRFGRTNGATGRKIPTGFHPSARRCPRPSGYAGRRNENKINPEGVESIPADAEATPMGLSFLWDADPA